MTLMNSVHFFYTLSFISVILLWGISLINGTVWALLKVAYFGTLPDGSPFLNRYTGIFALDFPLALLVAFFNYGTNDHDHAYQIFLLDAYATLQPAYVWMYIESARADAPLPFLHSPLLHGLLSQMLGGAIALPLFYAHHLTYALARKPLPRASVNSLRSIPLGFFLGAVLPVIAIMFPLWAGPDARHPTTHQAILAAFQPVPAWVAGIQSGIVILCGGLFLPRYTDARNASWVAQLSYGIAAVVSFVGHWHTIFLTVWRASANSEVSFARMFLPRGIYGPVHAEEILVRGPWLFLQYDYWGIALASVCWAFVLVRQADSGIQLAKLVVLVVLSWAVLGAGTTVSLMLMWREWAVQKASEENWEKGPLLVGTI